MSGPGFGVRVWPVFGRQPPRTPLMLVMLVLGLLLATYAAAQFEHFFDGGRAIRCMLLFGAGRFMHLVVLCGHQGTDTDSEQLASTGELFDAALGELEMVARDQPCLIVGDFNVEATKILCLAKGISAGLWVDLLLGLLLVVGSLPLLVSVLEVPLMVTEETSWWVALLLRLLSLPVLWSRMGGLCLILLLGLILNAQGGLVGLLSRFSVHLFGLLPGCLLLMRVGFQIC